MAGEFSVPPAPLVHHDSAAHRREIARRANVIGYEQGVFTPTFSFATPGDLSLSAYASQEGAFWRIGPLVFFNLRLEVTPTFSTASGVMELGGLPYQCVSDVLHIFTAQISSANVSYNGRTAPFGWIDNGDQEVKIAVEGSAQTAFTLTPAEFTSGSTTGVIRVQGVYPMSAEPA